MVSPLSTWPKCASTSIVLKPSFVVTGDVAWSLCGKATAALSRGLASTHRPRPRSRDQGPLTHAAFSSRSHTHKQQISASYNSPQVDGRRSLFIRHFSSSSGERAEYAAPPITLGSPPRATWDLLAWWNQSLRFSNSVRASRQPNQEDASQADLVDAFPHEPSSDYLDVPSSDFHALMRHPHLYDNIRKPRNVIVLCHGLYGFDFRGPFWGLEIHYWAAVLDILRKKIGADVIVRGVPGTGSISSRAEALHKFLCSEEAGIRGAKVNFIGHSMGGLDARYLVSHLRPKPEEYIPVSITCISTPNRGSPFMDWCNANVGIGREYVEECIKEYELKKGMWKSGEQSDGSEAVAEKLPYSLKTPLFVRSKKDGSNDSERQANCASENGQTSHKGKAQQGEQRRDGSLNSSERHPLPSDESSPPTPASESLGKSSETKTSKASLSVVTPLTRALSSLSGYFSSYMLSVLDQPAYAMLSTRYMAKVFNPSTPDMPNIKYFSVAARTRKIPLWHPLWLPKVILDAAAEARTAGSERDGSAAALGDADNQGNDGLVSIQSAKWGTFLGVMDGCDHWDLRGGGAPRWGTDPKINPATGKPWSSAKEAEKAEAKNAAMKESSAKEQKEKLKKEDDGWLAINRLLRGLVGSKTNAQSSAGSQVVEAATSMAETLTATESGTVHRPGDARGESNKKEENPSSAKSGKPEGGCPGQTDDSKNSSKLEAARDSAQAFLEQYAIVPEASSTKRSGPPGSPPKKGAGDSADEQDNVSVFMDEVASWISDRLPQGSQERRDLADQTAREQEEGMRLALVPHQGAATGSQTKTSPAVTTHADPHRPSKVSSWEGSDVHSPFDRPAAAPTSSPSSATPQGFTLATGPTVDSPHIPEVGAPRFKAKEDVPVFWQPPPSPLVDITQQQQQQQQQQPIREAPAGNGAGSSGKSAGEPSKRGGTKGQTQSAQERLERFWIALCQHLYSHGL